VRGFATTRRWCARSLAALLLVLQGLSGGAVTLAHAREPFTAPAHLEAQQGSSCIPLHDPLRCALCHFAGAPITPAVARHPAPDVRLVERRPAAADPAPHTSPDHLTAPPRAPPVSLS
jgi:hypothetical protein